VDERAGHARALNVVFHVAGDDVGESGNTFGHAEFVVNKDFTQLVGKRRVVLMAVAADVGGERGQNAVVKPTDTTNALLFDNVENVLNGIGCAKTFLLGVVQCVRNDFFFFFFFFFFSRYFDCFARNHFDQTFALFWS
jgi:hypothetical protein